MNDVTLIQGCVNKDRATWDIFVARFSRLIYDAIIRSLQCYGRRVDKDTIADLHNDVFIFLLDNECRALRAFEGRNGCKLSYYLRTIAVRKTIDYLRKLNSDELLPRDNNEKALAEQKDDSVEICEVMVQEEAVEITQDLLSRLREDEARLCRMLFYEGKTPAAIARELGISVDYFYVSKKRILNKLKTMAERKGIEI